jgi:hypothetical protein
MLHKAEEWKVIGQRSKNQNNDEGAGGIFGLMMKQKEVEGALACTWRRRTFELFSEIVVLMRDTGTTPGIVLEKKILHE